MKRILIILALLCVTLSGQTISIHTKDGIYKAEPFKGGTVAKPYDIGGGFVSIDFGPGVGVLIGAPNGAEFKTIVTDGPVIPTKGSTFLPDGGMLYIPYDPLAFRGGRQEIKPWEVIAIYYPHSVGAVPDPKRVAAIKAGLMQTTNFAEIQRWPRLKKFLELHDDKHLPQNTPFGQTDLGWLQRHWRYTTGGPDRVGWYNGVCEGGHERFNNWHYDGLFWIGVNYLENPRADLYDFGYRQAVAHATGGRWWFGPNAGFARFEKGVNFVGDQTESVSWSKQWSAGLIVWQWITGDPLLRMQVDLMREQLRRSNPDTIWKGYWGARIGSHYLTELLHHYLDRREDWIAQKAAHFIRNCRAWRAEDLCWDNRGSRTTESPWMQTQLVTAIFKWIEQVPALKSEFPIDDLMATGAAIWQKGHIRNNGKPMLKYRFRGFEQDAPSMHLTAFAVPMLRYMAAHDPAFVGLHNEVKSFVFGWAGTWVKRITKYGHTFGVEFGLPRNLDTIGWRNDLEGLGWSGKAIRFYLEACR